ncbi:MAG: site-specific DNA-methyltransferase [Betaproteobacteria bacterium]|nr:site-specific DNA-methyltransferase [Betaproteobacteria bacterium]
MPFLDWVNKAQAQRATADVPYHLLEFQSAHGDGDARNLLIQGDNLLALKALLPFYRRQVKCIFIDPPYNTQSAFEHYDDKLEHSQWLSMMWPRLVLLRELLADDGSIWVSIDDREAHYLKVLMDEAFVRANFINSVVWIKTSSVHNNAEFFSSMNDTVHVFAKNISTCKFNRVPRSARNASDYTNPDDDPHGDWSSSPLHVSLTSGQRGAQFARTGTSSGLFPIINPHGVEVFPPKGRAWGYSSETIASLRAENRIWWGKDGRNQPRLKRYFSELKDGAVPTTVWSHEEVGHNQEAKKETAALLQDESNDLFSTPKPERLLQRIIHIATSPGDLVLDSFLGSGTTAAVAQKMGRRFIGIEMGEHAKTHCLPRLEKVIAGEQGGISKSVNWQGGGGFRFHTLGEPVFDADGGIHSTVRFAALGAYLWHFETGEPARRTFDSPLLGVHQGTAYYLLYNGILGDRRPAGGNVLTSNVLAHLDTLSSHVGPRVIYGETTRLGEARLREAGITFKQIPYDIKAR